MARPSSSPDPFASAIQVLRGAHREYRERRLTPPAPAPRDSDPTVGYPEPEHPREAAELPPSSTRWAPGGDDASDDGTRG